MICLIQAQGPADDYAVVYDDNTDKQMLAPTAVRAQPLASAQQSAWQSMCVLFDTGTGASRR